MVFNGLELWRKIRENVELQDLEQEGFCRGDEKGKTMDVHRELLIRSLHKQYLDFLEAWRDDDEDGMKRTLADLRNVAGCFFLKLKEAKE